MGKTDRLSDDYWVARKKKKNTDLDERYWVLARRVAANIRRIRENSNQTQEDMISHGFERRWFQRIESGRYSVSLPTLDKVARALRVDVMEFFKT